MGRRVHWDGDGRFRGFGRGQGGRVKDSAEFVGRRAHGMGMGGSGVFGRIRVLDED